jgi:hypothetical protein
MDLWTADRIGDQSGRTSGHAAEDACPSRAPGPV